MEGTTDGSEVGRADILSVRPVTADDENLLFRVFVSARETEFASLGLPPEQLNALLALQFRAQNASYGSQCTNPDFAMVLWNDRPIGRLYLDRKEGEIHVVDLALLSEYRNRGIGTAVLRQVLTEALADNKRVTLHVAHGNRAAHLYIRLGFVPVTDNGIYCLMEFAESNR
jgi:ribosomal protein S18 acetylase RimI-like enzyme